MKLFGAFTFLLLRCFTLSAQEYSAFTDPRDGREYLTVRIGQQEWMAENLSFKSESAKAMYLNDSPLVEIFGRYYCWEVALEVCPDGWHLPTEDEWGLLVESLGGEKVAGGKMKSISIYWTSKIDTLSNSSGFSALPGGYLEDPDDSTFPLMGDLGLFWSATEKNRSTAIFRYVDIDNNQFKTGSGSKESGISVRCLKD